MPWQMPIQDAWQIHLLHQRQEHHKVIDALVRYRQFLFHAPQYARKFLFCLAHSANGEYVNKVLPFLMFLEGWGMNILTNAIYQSDCLALLERIEAEQVMLVYIDAPSYPLIQLSSDSSSEASEEVFK